MSELESLKSARAIRIYLEARQGELMDWMLKPHKYRLRTLIEWCKESDVDDLTRLGSWNLCEFRV